MSDIYHNGSQGWRYSSGVDSLPPMHKALGSISDDDGCGGGDNGDDDEDEERSKTKHSMPNSPASIWLI